VGRDHVRVVEGRRRPDLAQEPVPRPRPVEELAADDLQHLVPGHQGVAGQVDDAHPAAAEFPDEFVVRVLAQVERWAGRRPRADLLGNRAGIAEGHSNSNSGPTFLDIPTTLPPDRCCGRGRRVGVIRETLAALAALAALPRLSRSARRPPRAAASAPGPWPRAPRSRSAPTPPPPPPPAGPPRRTAGTPPTSPGRSPGGPPRATFSARAGRGPGP